HAEYQRYLARLGATHGRFRAVCGRFHRNQYVSIRFEEQKRHKINRWRWTHVMFSLLRMCTSCVDSMPVYHSSREKETDTSVLWWSAALEIRSCKHLRRYIRKQVERAHATSTCLPFQHGLDPHKEVKVREDFVAGRALQYRNARDQDTIERTNVPEG